MPHRLESRRRAPTFRIDDSTRATAPIPCAPARGQVGEQRRVGDGLETASAAEDHVGAGRITGRMMRARLRKDVDWSLTWPSAARQLSSDRRPRRRDPGRAAARARRRGARRRAPATATGSRRRTAPTRSMCSSARRPTGSPSSCPCATAGCSSRLHLLPRRRGDHGRRPRGDAELRALGPGVRRRPPLELRRLRGAGPRPGRRRQRLRRDPARAVGVGRQAAGGELRDRRPRPWVRRRASGAQVVLAAARAYREAMRELRRARATSTSGTGASTSPQIRDAFAPQVGKEERKAASSATSPRPSARTGCGRSRS